MISSVSVNAKWDTMVMNSTSRWMMMVLLEMFPAGKTHLHVEYVCVSVRINCCPLHYGRKTSTAPTTWRQGDCVWQPCCVSRAAPQSAFSSRILQRMKRELMGQQHQRDKPRLYLVPVVQLLSCLQLFATPGAAAFQALLSFTVPQSLLKLCPPSSLFHPTISSSVTSFSSALHLSQHQGLLQWVGSSHQMAKSLKLKL